MTYNQFKLIHAVAALAHRSAEKAGYSLFEARDEDVNPFHTQVTQGMIVKIYYGAPSEIMSVWGGYKISNGSAGYQSEEEEMLRLFLNDKHIRFSLFAPEREVSGPLGGIYGPWYAVEMVGGTQLPTPSWRKAEDYIDYDVVKAEWAKLTSRFLTEKVGKMVPFTAMVRAYPSDVAKQFSDQRVLVKEVKNGYATVFPMNVTQSGGMVGTSIPLTDLFLFKEGLIK